MVGSLQPNRMSSHCRRFYRNRTLKPFRSCLPMVLHFPSLVSIWSNKTRENTPHRHSAVPWVSNCMGSVWGDPTTQQIRDPPFPAEGGRGNGGGKALNVFNLNPNFLATRNAIFFKAVIIDHSPIERYLDKRPYRMILLPHSHKMTMRVRA